MKFNFLHLTDWHQGMTGQKTLWPAVKTAFFEDLERLHAVAGPWNVLFFTGDLTQQGSKEEFQEMDRTLDELFARLKAIQGIPPLLLAVPGNHDLQRPNGNEQWCFSLKDWGDAQEHFFTNETWRTELVQRFSPYENWWKRHCPPGTNHGLLPGDFSYVFEKDGKRIGILGLNSTFLQFRDNMQPGSMDVDIRQLLPACHGDLGRWADGTDLCLLMTHHPPSWLSKDALDERYPSIKQVGKVKLHLFGHMHDSRVETISRGGDKPESFLQGSSLFGLEEIGATKELERQHGYLAGRMELGESEATCTLWPRLAVRGQSKNWQLVSDYTYTVQSDVAHVSISPLALNKRVAFARVVPTPVISPLGTPSAPIIRRALLLGVQPSPESGARDHQHPITSDTLEPLNRLKDALEKAHYSVRLEGIESELTLTRLKRNVRDFFKSSEGTEGVLIYLQAPRIQLEGKTYLVPADAQPEEDGSYAPDALVLEEDLLTLSPPHPHVLWCVEDTSQQTAVAPRTSASTVRTDRSAVVLLAEGSAQPNIGLADWLATRLAQAGPLSLGVLVDSRPKGTHAIHPHAGEWRDRLLLDPPTKIEPNLDAWMQALENSFASLSAFRDQEDLQSAARELVRTCRTLWDMQVQSIPEDPWRDERLPVRALEHLTQWMNKLSPAPSPEESVLLLVMPFVREAVFSAGACWFEQANPLDVKASGSLESPRYLLEQEHLRRPALVRKLEKLDEGPEHVAAARWMVHQVLLRTPRLWYTPPDGEMPAALEQALQQFIAQLGDEEGQLTTGLLLSLAKSLGTHPERLEQKDRENPLLPVHSLLTTRGKLELRLRGLGYLLCLAGWLARDLRMLDEMLVEHIGLDDNFDLDEALEAFAGATWHSQGNGLTLKCACPHPAVHFVLNDLVSRADEVLARLHLKREAPEHQYLAPFPSRLTANGLAPARDAQNHDRYTPPLVRFQLDHGRIRDLLMGEQLYGDPTLAIRELYQNALDACRYRQAREQFLRRSAAFVGKAYEGKIQFRQAQDDFGQMFIECRDNGVGMGRLELESLFARAGQRFHDVPEYLEEQAAWKRCEPPIEHYPNSQFGIGVLSYFMLADEIEILTRRYQRNGKLDQPLRIHISSRGGLFRIVPATEEEMPESGTKVTLKLARETYTYFRDPHSRQMPEKKSVSCRETLESLLWIAEFYTEVTDETGKNGVLTVPWIPEDPHLSQESPSRLLETGFPNVWWSDRSVPVLVDGIATDEQHRLLLINLVGTQYPKLTADRRHIVDWKELDIPSIVDASFSKLLTWDILPINFLQELDRQSPVTSKKLLKLLWDRNLFFTDSSNLDSGGSRLPVQSIGSWFLWHETTQMRRLRKGDSIDTFRRNSPLGIWCIYVGLLARNADLREPLESWERNRAEDVVESLRTLDGNLPESWKALAKEIRLEDGQIFSGPQSSLQDMVGVSVHTIVDACVRYDLPLPAVLERVACFNRAGLIRSRVNVNYVGSLNVLPDDGMLAQNCNILKGPITRESLLTAFFELRWPLRRLLNRLIELTPLGLKWQGLNLDLLKQQLAHPNGWHTLIDLPTVDDFVLLFQIPQKAHRWWSTGFTVGWLKRHAERREQHLTKVVVRARAWSEMLQWKMPDFDVARVEPIGLTDNDRELVYSSNGMPLDFQPYFPPGLMVATALRRRCSLREVCDEIVKLRPLTPPLPDIDWDQVEEPEAYRQDIEELGLLLRSAVRLLDCLPKTQQSPADTWRRLQKFIPLGLKLSPLDADALEDLELSPDDWSLLTHNYTQSGRFHPHWPRGHALKAAFFLRRPLPEVLERMRQLSVLGLGDVPPLPDDASLDALDEDDHRLLGWETDSNTTRIRSNAGEPLTAELLRFVGWFLPDIEQRIDRFRRWGLLDEDAESVLEA